MVARRDIRYWLEITCFWFVMILYIMIYIGGWWRLLISAKWLPTQGMESTQCM